MRWIFHPADIIFEKFLIDSWQFFLKIENKKKTDNKRPHVDSIIVDFRINSAAIRWKNKTLPTIIISAVYRPPL